jgi:hypothetical protein
VNIAKRDLITLPHWGRGRREGTDTARSDLWAALLAVSVRHEKFAFTSPHCVLRK